MQSILAVNAVCFAISNLGAFYIGLMWDNGPAKRQRAVLLFGAVALVMVIAMAVSPLG